MSRNLDQDPSGEFEDVRPLPMSKSAQDEEIQRMREVCGFEDDKAIFNFFEEIYGYRPVPPMPEDVQKRVLDVFRRSRETDDPVKLRALFEEKYGFKPTI